jgi:hypothetical protein
MNALVIVKVVKQENVKTVRAQIALVIIVTVNLK